MVSALIWESKMTSMRDIKSVECLVKVLGADLQSMHCLPIKNIIFSKWCQFSSKIHISLPDGFMVWIWLPKSIGKNESNT